MVSVRINFKSYDVKKFLTFTMNEAFDLVNEYDSETIMSVHFYPNYNE